ncbi:hypothetical protein ACI2I3_05815 [Psychrobacter namhaensis]|jgi:hypothetical protein|uniref:Uncharacterized protein n=1 Tax=Psychrobacter namhaensis TaxID=292734 RepID=A0ABW8L7G2_9GAMM|nr:hypothetical protein [Psychrobacter sp. UBA3068]
MATYKLMGAYTRFNDSNRRRYKDLCAPTITLAVGLKSGVVLHPITDSTMVVSSKAALIWVIFLSRLL